MLQLPIAFLPASRVLVSVFVPEHAADGAQLGTLVEDPGCLEPFGLSGATIAECKLCGFACAKVGTESAKFAGTSIGHTQLMADVMGMGVPAEHNKKGNEKKQQKHKK